jgi:hypothetical protein
VYVKLAVAVPNRVEVHPDLALRAFGEDDLDTFFVDSGSSLLRMAWKSQDSLRQRKKSRGAKR